MKTNQENAASSILQVLDRADLFEIVNSTDAARAEHAALVAVAEAAQDALAFRADNECRHEFIAREKFQSALANLAAVREGG